MREVQTNGGQGAPPFRQRANNRKKQDKEQGRAGGLSLFFRKFGELGRRAVLRTKYYRVGGGVHKMGVWRPAVDTLAAGT